MTRNELEDHLHALLAGAAHDSPQAPRPQGTFVANSPREGVSGMRVVAPDGATFYLAVLEKDAFRIDDAPPTPGLAPTAAQLTAVLTAAKYVLGARQDQMLTAEEWVDLARAVATCIGQKTADLLTERDLEQVTEDPPLPWDEGVDGPLPESD
jgi:hypothetical protein